MKLGEVTWKKEQRVYVVLGDLEKVYDGVNKEVLW